MDDMENRHRQDNEETSFSKERIYELSELSNTLEMRNRSYEDNIEKLKETYQEQVS